MGEQVHDTWNHRRNIILKDEIESLEGTEKQLKINLSKQLIHRGQCRAHVSKVVARLQTLRDGIDDQNHQLMFLVHQERARDKSYSLIETRSLR